MKQRILSLILVLAMVLSMIPSVFAAGCDITVTAPTPEPITTGSLYELPLNGVFSDPNGHTLTYSLTEDAGGHAYIKDGTLYFTTPDAGSYSITVTATCTDGGEASATVALTVNEAEAGDENQYDYDETNQESVRVYVTISNNGVPILSKDGATPLAHLEVNIPYFSLERYGMSELNRYHTENGSGGYVDSSLVERPTLLHLYIYMLERYYLGCAEEECGKGTSELLSYTGDGSGVYDLFGNSYEDTLDALTITGSATSMYMSNFWGHDENLMYYRNHVYPLMGPGWGATADYILLSDGDTIDLAMFSNWSFWNSGAFACFDKDEYAVTQGATIAFKTQKYDTKAVSDGGSEKIEPITDLAVTLYTPDWSSVSGYENLVSENNDGSYTLNTSALEPGVYYLMGLDPNKATDDACYAPATAKVVVKCAEGAHRWNDGVTVKEKTCTEAGELLYTCTVCGETKTETVPAGHDYYNGVCRSCGEKDPSAPHLAEGVTDLTVTVQVGKSYQLDDLMDGKIFTVDNGTLDYNNYFYTMSSDGGATWSKELGFEQALFGGINKSLSQSVAGTYLYRFRAWVGADRDNRDGGYSADTWTLTLVFEESVRENISFYVGRDQNYETNGNVYPKLELYRTAGIDENQFDYVGWFTDAEGKTKYVYNPAAYQIVEGETDYVEIDGTQYELHDYEKITFTNSAFDASDETATASGTVVNNYNMFYATLSTGRYSTRAYGRNSETEAYDVYLGGQSLPLPMEKDIYGGGGNDIYLGIVSCYATTKNPDTNKYFGVDDYYVEMIMPVTGSMIHAGTPYTYVRYGSEYTAYPFLSYEAGNASLYNIYAYPRNTEKYMFNQAINQNTKATYSVTTKSISIANARLLTVNAPASAEFGLYFQYNNFNTQPVAPFETSTDETSGMTTYRYRVSQSNSNYTWRLTDKSNTYVTKAGWLGSLSADAEKTYTFTEGDATDRKTHDLSKLGTTVSSRDEADLQVFLSHSGFKSVSDTYRVRAFRMWELIDSDTANIMVEPKFNVQMLQGSDADVKQVSGGNAEGNWIDVTPTGTDIAAVTYDAVDMYSNKGTAATHGGLFPATNPARTGVFVITNEAAGTADAQIVFNGGTASSRGAEWDYNYDTWYYLDTEEAPTLDFTVTESAAVSYAVVTTDASLHSTLSDWTDATADENGTFHASLLPFRTAKHARRHRYHQDGRYRRCLLPLGARGADERQRKERFERRRADHARRQGHPDLYGSVPRRG